MECHGVSLPAWGVTRGIKMSPTSNHLKEKEREVLEEASETVRTAQRFVS